MRSLVSAQDVTEPALKAAFIYNFAKFTEWPTDVVRASDPLVMCVLGDDAVADALARAIKGRVLGGHSIIVLHESPDGRQRICHVLYLSGMTAGQTGKLVGSMHDVPVLTISDVEGFTELGGIVQFYFENGQLRFIVHLNSAKRARLLISSRLLALATLN
jgi:hypothetical protein